MKVGDYVRTKEGHIDKIVKISDEMKSGRTIKVEIGEEDIIGGYKDFVDWFNPSHFTKSSPNIIELFEKHDLVVIEYYSLRYKERVTRLFEVTFKDDEYINLSNAKCEFMLVNGEFNKGDKELKPVIKSIVTKERFEAMQYKVGE